MNNYPETMPPLNALIGFAAHGRLPFAGRERELEQIRAFCAGLDDAESMRVALVSGEAGIGKSRLFEEALSGIADQQRCVVRVKLHVDTAGSLMALIADALWHTPAARAILKTMPESSLVAVTGSLRRLARLRQVLVIVEDIHLLSDRSVEQFAAFVAALADEPIGMLLSARPVALAIRGIVEPVLALSLELRGLGDRALRTIWAGLFGDDHADRHLMDLLLLKTLGNPLALHMALRTGLRSADTEIRADDGPPLPYPDRSALERTLDRSTRLMAEGMMAHLNHEEREWAGRLAALGEIMSPEAARITLGGNDHAVEALRAKGIIIESATTPAPMGKLRSAPSIPLVFSHTLIHRHFLEQKRFDIDRFWEVLAAGAPLYTLTPFDLAAEHGAAGSCDTEIFLKGIEKYTLIIKSIKRTFENAAATHLYRAFETTVAVYLPEVDGDAGLELLLRVQNLRMIFSSYHPFYDGQEKHRDYRVIIARYIRLTRRELTESLLPFRVNALAALFLYKSTTLNIIDHGIWKRMDHITAAYPHLFFDSMYISTLASVLSEVYRISDNNVRSPGTDELLQDVARRVEWIAAHAGEADLQILYTQVYPQLMMNYRDLEGYHRSKSLFAQSLRYGDKDDRSLYRRLVSFATDSEDVEQALTLAVDCLRRNERHAEKKFDTNIYIDWLIGLASSNTPFAEIWEQIPGLRAIMEPVVGISCWCMIMSAPWHLGVLRLDRQWVEDIEAMLSEHGGRSRYFFAELHNYHAQGAVAQHAEELRSLLEDHIRSSNVALIELSPSSTIVTDLARMAFGVGGPTQGRDEFDGSFKEYLDNRLGAVGPFMDRLTLLALLVHAEDEGISDLSVRFRPEIRDAIFRMMTWLIETRRIVFARVFPAWFPRFFETEEITAWTALIDRELAAQDERLRPSTNDTEREVEISMLGNITYRRNDEERRGVKGIRLKQLLGLMTLDAIIPRPLTRSEFFAIATEDGATDETRRNTVKMAVYQLRKLLGPESILQGRETPRLNTEVVRVDLIDAHTAMGAVETELNGGSLKKGTAELYRALHLLNGEVAFPTLYDPVFESAREDLETRLRRIAMSTCQRLLREGDEENCEGILRLAVRQFAGDEEMSEMLLQVLHAREKRTDAVRMMMAGIEEEIGG